MFRVYTLDLNSHVVKLYYAAALLGNRREGGPIVLELLIPASSYRNNSLLKRNISRYQKGFTKTRWWNCDEWRDELDETRESYAVPYF